jgi:predicted permease
LLNSLALRLIPAVDADRLVHVYPIDREGRRQNLFSYPDYRAIEAGATQFAAVAAYIPHEVTLRSPSRPGESVEPREAIALVVSTNYFALLGARPALGRTLAPGADDLPDGAASAVISHRLWQRLGAPEAILGRVIGVNGRAFTIVGVMPASFVGALPIVPDLWVPLSMRATVAPASRGANDDDAWLLVLGRLRSGVSRASVELQASALVSQLTRTRPPEHAVRRVRLTRATFFPIERDPVGIAALVLTATLLLLVAASANVATLLLARALSRQREYAVRLALGSSAARLVRQVMAESGLLVALAGLGALLLTSWALSLLYAFALPRLPFEWGVVVLDLSPDWRVLGVTTLLCFLAAVSTSAAPALQARRVDVTEALHGSIAMFGRRLRPSRVRGLLVNTQVAISATLIVLAGLLARSAIRAEALDLGFEPRDVLLADYDLARHRYSDARAAAFTRALAERAAALPGVVSSAAVSHVALTGGVRTTRVSSPDRPVAGSLVCRYVIAGPGSFATLATPIVSGRDLDARGRVSGVPEAVVSEVLAARLWPGLDPIGRRLRTGLRDRDYVVVGMVRDTRTSSLWRDKEAAVYLGAVDDADVAATRLIVRVKGDQRTVDGELRRIVQSLEPDLAVNVVRLEESVALWIVPARVAAAAGGLIGALALAFACFGAYGVMRHVLAQQRRELGIRLALGADVAGLVGFALRQSVPLVVPGLTLGVLAGYLTGRLVSTTIFGIKEPEILTPIVGGGAVALAAALACYLPSRKAASIDPMTVLRTE